MTVTRKRPDVKHFDLEKPLMEPCLDPSPSHVQQLVSFQWRTFQGFHLPSPQRLFSKNEMPITTTRTRFPSKSVEFAELEPAPLEVIKIIGVLTTCCNGFSQTAPSKSLIYPKQLHGPWKWWLFKSSPPSLRDLSIFALPTANHSFSWGVSDSPVICSVCVPEEIRPLSWSHWAIKFASSWGDKFSAWWKEHSPGDFKWCSFSDETSIGCFFHERNFSYDKSRVAMEKIVQVYLFRFTKYSNKPPGHLKIPWEFLHFPRSFESDRLVCQALNQLKEPALELSPVILRRQRFLFD